MVPRFLTLLLTVILMTGVASAASGPDLHPGAAAVIDNAPDSLELDPAIMVRPLALPAPIAEVVSQFAPVLQPATGRFHAVLVFRPPR